MRGFVVKRGQRVRYETNSAYRRVFVEVDGEVGQLFDYTDILQGRKHLTRAVLEKWLKARPE